MTYSAAQTYITIIDGTRNWVTLAMERIPPRMTSPVASAMNSPVYTFEMPRVVWTASATELLCTMLPMPNAARAANIENRTPSHGMLAPRDK